MIVTVTLKDAKRRQHEVSLWAGEDVDIGNDEALAEMARGNLRLYADAGTSQADEPFELVEIDRAEGPA